VIQSIIGHPIEITTNGSNIVGLGRVSHCIILIETNALLGKVNKCSLKGPGRMSGNTESCEVSGLTVVSAEVKSVFSSQICCDRMRRGNVCKLWRRTYCDDAVEDFSGYDLRLR